MAEKQYVMVFKRFERFWHWSQAALIFILLITGARLHGLIDGPGYWGDAFQVHLFAAGLIVVLWIFAIFWHLTTGEWKNYIPTLDRLGAVIRYYAYGIFLGEAHPAKPTLKRKHNPLQRLSYLFLKLIINPAIWITGVMYIFVNQLGFNVATVAWLHVVAAYAMATFVIVHIYMAFSGHPPTEYVKAMITGYEWLEADDEPLSRT